MIYISDYSHKELPILIGIYYLQFTKIFTLYIQSATKLQG
jgi:hypothetical protein